MIKNINITKRKFLNNCDMTETFFEKIRERFIQSKGIQELQFFDIGVNDKGKVLVVNSNPNTLERATYIITNRNLPGVKKKKYSIELLSYSIERKNTEEQKKTSCTVKYPENNPGHINLDVNAQIPVDVCFGYDYKQAMYTIPDYTTQQAILYAKGMLESIPEVMERIDFSVLSDALTQEEKEYRLDKFTGIPQEYFDVYAKKEYTEERKLVRKLQKRRIGNGWHNENEPFNIEKSDMYYMKRKNEVTSSNDSIIYNVEENQDLTNNKSKYKFTFVEYEKKYYVHEKETSFYSVRVALDTNKGGYYMQLGFKYCDMYLVFPVKETDEERLIQLANANLRNLISERYADIESYLNVFYHKVKVCNA